MFFSAVRSLMNSVAIADSTTSVSALAIARSTQSVLARQAAATAFLASVCSAWLLPALAARRGWSDGALMQLGAAGFTAAALLLASGTGAAAAADLLGYGLPAAGAVGVDRALFTAVVPMALAVAVQRAVPAAMVSKAAAPSMQGGAMGLLDAASSCCRVVAPLATGCLIDNLGLAAPFVLEAVLVIAGVLICTWVAAAPTDASGKKRA